MYALYVLDIYQFQAADLRNLVKGCGLDATGSKMDLLLRLREEMKTRSTYDMMKYLKRFGEHLVSCTYF